MYGLKRIALHNSYFSGMTVMFEADGHANASGGNGAGKTSALNLIPIFYGARPNDLVRQVADKSDFMGFYIPKPSSAIFFEHERVDGHRIVVLYRHSSGAKPVYRFVKGTLEDTFFSDSIKPLMEQGRAIHEVFLALSEIGVDYSRQIDTVIDYQALIHNDRRLLRRKESYTSANVALAREYCLGGPNDSMSHLDRMSHAILRRTDMFERLQRMIAETQFGTIHIDERPEHLQDKTLMQDIECVRDFATAEPRIRECIDRHHQYSLVIEDRNSVAAELLTRCREVKETRDRLVQQAEDLRNKMTSWNEAYRDKNEQLQNARQALLSEHNQIDRDLNHIFQQKQTWDDWDAVKRQAEYDNLDQERARLEAFQKDLDALTEKVAHLEQAREKATAEAQVQRDQTIQTCNAKQLEHSDKKNRTLIKYGDLKDQLRDTQNRELQQLLTGEIALEQQRLNNARIKAQLESERLRISDADQQQITALVEQAQTVTDERDELTAQRASCEAEFNALKRQHTSALDSLQKAKDHQRQCEDRINDISKLIYPKDGSLLSDLRQHDPAWSQTLGKVLRPDLLKRSDLQQVFMPDAGPTIFGWELNLDKIDTPDYAASEEAQQARLEEAQSHYRNAETATEEREAAAIQLQKELSPYDQQIATFNHRIQQSGNTIRDLNDRQRTRRKDAEHNAKQYQEEQKQLVKQLTEDLRELDQRLEARRKGINDTFQSSMLELKSREQSECNDIAHQITLLEQAIQQSHSDYIARISDIECRYTEQCENDGVDPQQVNEARTRMTEQKGNVSRIASYIDRLSEYQLWKNTTWASVDEKEKRYAELGAQCQSAADEIDRHTRDHRTRIKEAEKTLTATKAELKDIAIHLERASKVLKTCPLIEPKETERALVDLLSNLEQLLEQENTLSRQVLNGVNRTQEILNKYLNSRIYNAWRSLYDQRLNTSDADELSEQFRLRLPIDLKHLLDVNIPEVRDILIEQVRSVGDSLAKYHDCLKGLNTEVVRVSRHLGRKINTDQRIENLTDIELEITSVIIEGDYWEKLTTFNQLWAEWLPTSAVDLPPETLLLALQTANTSLQSARIDNDINSLIRLRISITENGRKVSVNNSRDFNNLSSNGLSYLAILVIFRGMSRYLCPNPEIALHWPIDELAALSPENIARIFDMFDESGIICFSAFPSTDPTLLKFFKHKTLIDRQTGIRHLSEKPLAHNNPLALDINALVPEEV